jgi:m7GpppX diphosphatase
MQVTIDNSNYKFIPSKLSKIDSISKKDLVLKNDVYEKYNATAQVDGELIICNDINQMRPFEKKIIRETYNDYLKYIKYRDPRKDQWIYNIINGTSEQESILYRDELCIIIPTYMWDGNNIEKMHLLCLPTDTTLRSIRSLTSSHIPLLEHMKRTTLHIIKQKYNIDEDYIKMFFHYEPSTYHLHIHFVNVAHHDARSSVEYSHELNNVIFNLLICSDYYNIAVLNKRT